MLRSCLPIHGLWITRAGNLLIIAQQILGFNRPSNADWKSVETYMFNRKPLIESERSWIYHKEDLLTLRAGREHAWLDDGIEHLLRWFHSPIVEVSRLMASKLLKSRSNSNLENFLLQGNKAKVLKEKWSLLHPQSHQLISQHHHHNHDSHSSHRSHLRPLSYDQWCRDWKSLCHLYRGFACLYSGIFRRAFAFHKSEETWDTRCSCSLLCSSRRLSWKCQSIISLCLRNYIRTVEFRRYEHRRTLYF